MSFSDKMNQIKSLELEIARMVDDLKKELSAAVAAQPMRGQIISDGKNGRPLIGVVRLSELSKSGNWSPEYYFPQKQAEAVGKKLSKCTTVKDVCKAISAMIADKKVNIGSGNNNVIYLNDETLRILRESEIGQYVIRTVEKNNG